MFKSGNFDLKGKEQSCKPAIVDDQVKILIKNNPCHITQDFAGYATYFI